MATPYFLDIEEVLTATGQAIGATAQVGDFGLLAAAVARPQTTVFGQDAYPGLLGKAAALLHSLVRNHALIDGNKRAGWAAAAVFCEVNDLRLIEPLDVDAAEALVLEAAGGELDVSAIAERLARFFEPA